MVDKLDWLFELADRLSPLTCALLATFGIAVIAYLVFNDWMCKKRREYEGRISDLEEEIEKYNSEYERDQAQIRELNRNPKAMEKIARERYFMKADDEDIFVLSDDDREAKPLESHETTE